MKLFDPELRFFEHKLPRRASGSVLAWAYAAAGAVPLAYAFALNVPGGTVVMWCAVIVLAMAVCFYNKVTSGITLVAAAALAVYWFGWGGAWDWISGDFAASGAASAVFVFKGTPIPGHLHNTVGLTVAVLCAGFAYLSAGHLAGGVTMGAASLVLYIALWYGGVQPPYWHMAVAAAATASVCAFAYGRTRSHIEERALMLDYDAASSPSLMDSDGGEQYEPRVVSGGGASALAVGVIVYAIVIAVIAGAYQPAADIPALRSETVGTAVGSVFDSASEWADGKWEELGGELEEVGMGLPELDNLKDDNKPGTEPVQAVQEGLEVRGGGLPAWVWAVVLRVVAAATAAAFAALAVEGCPALVLNRKGRRAAVLGWWRSIRELEALEGRLFLRCGGAPECMHLVRERRASAKTRRRMETAVICARHRRREPSQSDVMLVWRYMLRLRFALALRITPFALIFAVSPLFKRGRKTAVQRLSR